MELSEERLLNCRTCTTSRYDTNARARGLLGTYADSLAIPFLQKVETVVYERANSLLHEVRFAFINASKVPNDIAVVNIDSRNCSLRFCLHVSRESK